MGALSPKRRRGDPNLDLDSELERRLEHVPIAARTRGVFFNVLEDQARSLGLGPAVARRILGAGRRVPYELYPTRDLLVLYANAGRHVHADPGEGIRRLFSASARYCATTWYGAALRRLLRPDPAAALQYVGVTRPYLANYGLWRTEQRGPAYVVMHMHDEYFWIETAQRGGCEGMLAACGVDGEVDVELDGPFVGRLHVRWAARR